MLRNYSNLVAFVAGCTGGLGGATTAKLLKLGATVVGLDIVDVRERRELEISREASTAIQGKNNRKVLQGRALNARNEPIRTPEEQIEIDQTVLDAQEKGKFIFHKGNITLTEDVEETLTKITHTGKFKLAVNCVGYSERVHVYNSKTDTPVEQDFIQDIMKTNVTGAFNFSRLCAKKMAKNDIDNDDDERGLIINTSGILGKYGTEYQAHLSAANGAVNSMTLPLSRDLAHCKIRAVTISPSFFCTNLIFLPHYEVSQRVEAILGVFNAFPNRLGEVGEYADMVMAVYENKMINGEVIELSAGSRPPP